MKREAAKREGKVSTSEPQINQHNKTKQQSLVGVVACDDETEERGRERERESERERERKRVR